MESFKIHNAIRLLPVCARLLFAAGCGRSNDVRRLSQMLGERIDFPTSMQTADDRNVTAFVPDTSKSHIVVYFDSMSCQSCSIKRIPEWDEFIDSLSRICSDSEVIFVLSPKTTDYREARNAMITFSRDYKIALDSMGTFANSNPCLSNDARFHTFLLNPQNEIIIVGSPLNNQAMWNLYKNELARMHGMNN